VDRLSPPQQHSNYLQDPNNPNNNNLPNGGLPPPLLPASLTPSMPQVPSALIHNNSHNHSASSSRSVSASGGPRRQQWTTTTSTRPPVFSPQTSPKVNPHHPAQLYTQSPGLGLEFSIGPPLNAPSTSEIHQHLQQQQHINGGYDQQVRGRGTESRALGSGRSSPGTPPYPPPAPRERSVLGTLSGSGVFGGVPEPDEREQERERARVSMRGPSVDARGRSGGGRVGDLRLSSGGGSTLGSGLGGSSSSSNYSRRAVSTPPPLSGSSSLHSHHSNAVSPAFSSTSTTQHDSYLNSSDASRPLPPPSINSYAPFGHSNLSSSHLAHLSQPSSPTYLSPSLLLSPTSGSNEVPHPLISASARAVGATRNSAPGRDSSTSRSRPPPSSRDEAEDLGKMVEQMKLAGMGER
jgi:hypothetical protein